MLKSEPFEVALATKSKVEIPKEHIQPFLDKDQRRLKVKATFENKSIDYHAALTRNKHGSYSMYFSKAKQTELGVFMNDYFTLQLLEDQSKYGAPLSEELEAVLLSDIEAYNVFERLTPGRQRSIIYTISRYKSSQTRVDKAIILTENLKRGITDPKLWLKQF